MNEFDVIDFDWFFIDQSKNVCHVASGGGTPPDSIANEYEGYSEVIKFFLGLKEISESVIINDKLGLYVDLRTITDNEQYFKSYVHYSKRGIISFDKTVVSDPSDGSYHLVCYPEKKLQYDDLPEHIRHILSKTILPNRSFPITGFNIKWFDAQSSDNG